MNIYEQLRVIDLVDRFDMAFHVNVPQAEARGAWHILSTVVRHELEGRPLTKAALSTASGLPHATALRRIDALVSCGLILRTTRTTSGKSFLYRPSPQLTARFGDFANIVKTDLARFMSTSAQSASPDTYYFGGQHQTAAYTDAQLRELLAVPGVAGIRFLLRMDWFFMALRHAWSDLRRSVGPAQNFTLLNQPELDTTMHRALLQPVSDWDIVALSHDSLPDLVGAGRLLPLPPPGAALAPYYGRIHRDVWRLAELGGQTYALPAYVTLDLLAARRDLFQEVGLGFPGTLSELIDVARSLHQPRRGRHGVIWSGAPGLSLARSFRQVLQMTQHPSSAKETAVASKAADAYAALQRLLEFSHPDVLHFDAEQTVTHFAAGEAAMCLITSLDATRFEFDVSSTVKHRVSYLSSDSGRGGPNLRVDGYMLAVPANLPRERQERALAVLRWLSGYELLEHEDNGKIPSSPLFSLVRDPEQARNSPIRNLVSLLVQQRRGAALPAPTLAGGIASQERFGQLLHQGLSAGANWATVLAALDAEDLVTAALRPPSKGLPYPR